MFEEFKKFLLQTNALALAVGVIIGAAVGKVVSSIVSDVLMPVVGVLIPGGEWRDLSLVLTRKAVARRPSHQYGALLGNLVDFVIVAFVVFTITKALIKPAPAAAAPAPATKECPECKEQIPAAARKCRMCASPV
jgi:large conductance mechanosensitive channel